MQNLIPNFKSRTRKLVINNKTAWDTRALRTVFLKVINENIKFEGPLQHGIRARVVYTRRGGYSGYAYFHSGTMTIRLPHPRRVKSDGSCPDCNDGNWYRAIIDDKLVDPTPCPTCNGTAKAKEPPKSRQLDTYQVAHLVEHELAHCRGYKHKGMCGLNGWKNATASYYPYLKGLTIGLKPEKAKPVIDVTAVRATRVAARIKGWETKLKRAETALKKLRKQQKYYARAQASA